MAGAPIPALLNSRSRRPYVSFARAKSALTEAGSPTSLGTTSVRPDPPPASAAAASSISLRRPAKTTEYPSRTRATAACLPTPVPAPVTTATLSDEVMSMLSASEDGGSRPGIGHRLVEDLSHGGEQAQHREWLL